MYPTTAPPLPAAKVSLQLSKNYSLCSSCTFTSFLVFMKFVSRIAIAKVRSNAVSTVMIATISTCRALIKVWNAHHRIKSWEIQCIYIELTVATMMVLVDGISLHTRAIVATIIIMTGLFTSCIVNITLIFIWRGIMNKLHIHKSSLLIVIKMMQLLLLWIHVCDIPNLYIFNYS